MEGHLGSDNTQKVDNELMNTEMLQVAAMILAVDTLDTDIFI